MKEEDCKVVVFLDTNALHYIHLYLMYAEEQRLYPFVPGEDAFVEPKEHLDNVQDTSLKSGLQDGLDIVASLSGPDVDVRVEYSPISELELIVGRARGKTTLKLAKEGVPERIWSKNSEELINSRLDIEDLRNVKEGVDKIGEKLEKAGIQATSSNPRRTQDVFVLAKEIAGLVYLESADNIIYASAIVAGADYVITRDSYLDRTINRIKTGQHPYDEVRNRLRPLIAKITLEAPDDVTLPKAGGKLPPRCRA